MNLLKTNPVRDLVEHVSVNLLDALSDGTLLPGARILQEKIAEKLAMSHSLFCGRCVCFAKTVLRVLPGWQRAPELCWTPNLLPGVVWPRVEKTSRP